jgi:hypothetical protein
MRGAVSDCGSKIVRLGCAVIESAVDRAPPSENLLRSPKRESRVFTEGTLVVDLIDPNLDQTVWRGWAIGVVDPNDQSEKTVAAFVKAVLDELPAR